MPWKPCHCPKARSMRSYLSASYLSCGSYLWDCCNEHGQSWLTMYYINTYSSLLIWSSLLKMLLCFMKSQSLVFITNISADSDIDFICGWIFRHIYCYIIYVMFVKYPESGFLTVLAATLALTFWPLKTTRLHLMKNINCTDIYRIYRIGNCKTTWVGFGTRDGLVIFFLVIFSDTIHQNLFFGQL